jgi:hypothetical protein
MVDGKVTRLSPGEGVKTEKIDGSTAKCTTGIQSSFIQSKGSWHTLTEIHVVEWTYLMAKA